MNTSALPKLALIAGPTASGKSALAIQIAERNNGVVINADSAQVYADLRVLSARPSEADEACVPHRLYGYIDGATTCTAVRWAGDAGAAIAEAHVAGKLPVLVGGSGLYLRTLLDGIAPVPAIDPSVRAAVRAMPVAEAHDQLAALDPNAAARLSPGDTTRVARALEVVRSTGRQLAAWQHERRGGIASRVDLVATVLLPDRDWLMARCDQRLAAMFDGGAIDEVERLLARRDLPADAPIRRAIGVREIAAWRAREMHKGEALERATVATRRYAKRQYTWFRNQPPADWRQVAALPKYSIIDEIETKLRS
ncbi:MAG: tRNA (adenosine(37)-N6)-dimethylallyltransferase MiaA [Sphingomonas sp.]